MLKLFKKKPKKVTFEALFDSMKYVESTISPFKDHLTNPEDYEKAKSFLVSYKGSLGTFTAYRRDLERLFQWMTLIKHKSLQQLSREDMEEFIMFCKKPPKTWIGFYKYPRFIEKDFERQPNPDWTPFIAIISKVARRKGHQPKLKDFEFTANSIKELLAIISSFYGYLLQEGYVLSNPISLMRQKSKFIRTSQGPQKIRRLSELQWSYVIATARDMAEAEPHKHHRTLFMLSCLYGMYLRISEVAASERWTPTMNHFHRDSRGNWWFTTVGKGNKQRQIAVSDSMLEALKVWRKHLGLSPLPAPNDQLPLFPKTKGKGPITHTSYIRHLIQGCFDEAIDTLRKDGFNEDADELSAATVHWLRHTGISDDVKIRPREHVRDDAGHSSSAITDKYIDVELQERHNSARHKIISE